MSVNPAALQKLLSEMSINMQKNQAEYQMVNVQLQRRANSLKLNDLTIKELQGEGNEKEQYDHVWKGVGKAFLQIPTKQYVSEVEKENAEINDEIKSLNIKKNYVETTLNNTAEGMNKILQRN